MSEEKKIKFVKAANMWLCMWEKSAKGKITYEQKWFSTRKQAEDFVESGEEQLDTFINHTYNYIMQN